MSERLVQLILLGGLILLPVKGVQAQPPSDPIYVKTSSGWNAAYAYGNEYAEFHVLGNGCQFGNEASRAHEQERENDNKDVWNK